MFLENLNNNESLFYHKKQAPFSAKVTKNSKIGKCLLF